jgi:hypothetical protein
MWPMAVQDRPKRCDHSGDNNEAEHLNIVKCRIAAAAGSGTLLLTRLDETRGPPSRGRVNAKASR